MESQSKFQRIAVLYFRYAMGLGFLIPVADRLGWLGPPGQNMVSWGNWGNFVSYTNVLMPFLGRSVANVMAWLATIAEVIIGLSFITGLKVGYAAISGFLLTLVFALCMAVFMAFKAPFTYSVFADSAGCLLLAWAVSKNNNGSLSFDS